MVMRAEEIAGTVSTARKAAMGASREGKSGAVVRSEDMWISRHPIDGEGLG